MIVKANKNFDKVYGADSFVEYFPQIMSTGVEVQKIGIFYYVMINNKPASDSAFFSEEELAECLEVLHE